METIEVGYKNAIGVGSDPYVMKHEFIIYTDSNGVETYYRGGPQSKDQGLFPIGVSNGPFGDVVTQSGQYLPGSPDYGNYPRETVMTGNDLSAQKAQLEAATAAINTEHHNYDATGPNSNSVVHEVLNRAGIPLPKTDGPLSENPDLGETMHWIPPPYPRVLPVEMALAQGAEAEAEEGAIVARAAIRPQRVVVATVETVVMAARAGIVEPLLLEEAPALAPPVGAVDLGVDRAAVPRRAVQVDRAGLQAALVRRGEALALQGPHLRAEILSRLIWTVTESKRQPQEMAMSSSLTMTVMASSQEQDGRGPTTDGWRWTLTQMAPSTTATNSSAWTQLSHRAAMRLTAFRRSPRMTAIATA